MTVFDGLVKRGTAIVENPVTGEMASAFRVAPGYAVTSGHVVDDGTGGAVSSVTLDFGTADGASDGDHGVGDGTISDSDTAFQAPVAAVSRAPSPAEYAAARATGRPGSKPSWPYPDVAVLVLPEDSAPDTAQAPCVLMSEVALTERVSTLATCGLAVPFNHLGRVSVEPGTYDGTIDAFLKINAAMLRAGRSGGPAFAPDFGAVVGVVKASADTRIPTGGLAVPLLPALRALGDPRLYRDIVTAHDRYHQVVPSWRAAPRTQGPASDRWSLFARLVALLAQLPQLPGDSPLRELYRMLCPADPSPVPAGRLLAPRDLAELLFTEWPDRGDHLCALGIWLPEMAGASTPLTDALRTLAEEIAAAWGKGTRVPLPLGVASATSASAIAASHVIGVISPAVHVQTGPGTAHLAQLYVVHGTGDDRAAIPWEGGGSPTPSRDFESAKLDLQRLLDEYLAYSEDEQTAIEVALPDEYLAEDLQIWRRVPADPRDPRTFSDDYRIELRRSATFERNREQWRLVKQHFSALSQMTGAELSWLRCFDHRSTEQLRNALLGAHGIGVDDPPSENVLYYSSLKALPLMIWRRRECEDHTEGDRCSGLAFRRSLCSSFEGVPPTRWYERVNSVQRDAARSRLPDGHDGYAWRDVVYLLERPGHHKRLVPMAGPHHRGSSST